MSSLVVLGQGILFALLKMQLGGPRLEPIRLFSLSLPRFGLTGT